jgi:phenylacetate-CoA ligase
MLVVRGVNVYPSAVEELLRSCGVTEFRATLSRRGALPELGIEAEAEDDAAVRKAEAALRDAFALRVEVTRAGNGTLPRFEGKAKRWVRRE